ncbi:hypothetical protein Gohar_002987 [Gossypium harknessii]|uniref:RNase H type-1 domain-containing protein n=1 Tax=Gossypium harknessii TaxID=34285 RepID=A0A7J9HMK4_9ROSI|nr:hypothetical protein [Gossypium harknessii]
MVETEDWNDLKTDGAIKINRGCIATGGVLRDHNGSWILGFNCRLGKCLVFEAELWGILNGVMLVQGRQHNRILGVENWSIEHVPREDNAEADHIANLAFDKGKVYSYM